MSPSPTELIEARLERVLGLNVSSIGRSAVEAAVEARLRALRLGIASYAARLDADLAELGLLVDEIVVPETWFFRDGAPFRALARMATRQLADPRGRFSVLSLACSTGEEPYSAAMALADAGAPFERIIVDALDVSERLLGLARAASYGPSSFRGADLRYREEHFTRIAPERWQLKPEIREKVTFQQGNAIGLAAAPYASYHAIFCRNLLIYLVPAARARVLDSIGPLLAENGVLFAGHAESLNVIDPRFQIVDQPSFAYRFTKARPRSGSHLAIAPKPQPAPLPLPATPRVRPPAPPPAAMPPAASSSPPVAVDDLLRRAAELADRGELAPAAELCREALAAGPHAEALYLLGIIGQAKGDDAQAESNFQRALYCEPRHYLSLVHLALIHERRGERDAAANFRRRAERARGKGKGA